MIKLPWKVKSLLVSSILLFIVGGCTYLNQQLGLKNDHPVEEFIEGVLESQIGIDIDLSSPLECGCPSDCDGDCECKKAGK